MLDRDWIDGSDLYVEPSPSRLRTACLMIYAGLLLSLGAVLSSFPAAAQADEPAAALSIGAESRGSVRYREDAFPTVPICDQRCRVPAF